MTRILLFCTTEEAKPLLPKVLSVEKASQGIYKFFLVEDHVTEAPEDPRDSASMFRSELNTEESFETEFINASEEDCQDWAVQRMARFQFIEQDIIAILDKESVAHESVAHESVLVKYHYQHLHELHSALLNMAPDVVYPIYFGRKEELTDENGIFDVERAMKLSTDPCDDDGVEERSE